MKKIIRTFIFVILQFAVIIAAFVLESLATKRMGVNRYLLFTKTKYSDSLLTPDLVKIYGFIAIIGIIIFITFFFIQLKKRGSWFSSLLAVVYQIVGIIVMSKDSLYAYPFFVLGIWIVIIFQYVFVFVQLFQQR